MTAKDFLAQYRAAVEKIHCNRCRMLRTEQRAWEICSRSYFEYTSDYEDKLWAENEELAGVMVKVEKIIEKVPNETQKRILVLRYIDGRRWKDIAEEMCYSEQHLHRLHKRALWEISMMLKTESGDSAFFVGQAGNAAEPIREISTLVGRKRSLDPPSSNVGG